MLLNMEEILSVAHKNNFAIPAFNISNYAMLNGIFEICETKSSPVIIAIHPNELRHIGIDMVEAIVSKANHTHLPVCIHLDHGANINQVMLAVKAGFTSVMIDGSSFPLDENIRICKETVSLMHPIDVSVEGEIGTIGTIDSQSEHISDDIIFTNPGDAVSFVEETEVDALAIAIGTSHGLYPKGLVPKLRLDLLKEIKNKVNIPLVLHGGSGNSDNEIFEAVKLGINKVNISSDIKNAYYCEMRNVLQNISLREPHAIEPRCKEAMKQVAAHKIDLFCSSGKSLLY